LHGQYTVAHVTHESPEFAGQVEVVVIAVVSQKFPTPQFVQLALDIAATVAEYLPTGQLVHAAELVALLYFPATHAEHGPPFGPVYPDLQMQAVRATLVVGELEPSGHMVHKTLPVVSL
jgi:hypothetical protein